jgi:hypothetical protein
MLAHVRMVGRALEGDVQSDGEPVLVGDGDQAAEVLDRAELGVD